MQSLLFPTLLATAVVIAAQSHAGPLVIAPRVVLRAPAVARTAPPSGPLNVLVGQKVQSLPTGTELEVLGKKSYGTFGGSNVWLEVKPVQSPAQPHPGRVWIYGGVQSEGSVVPSGVTSSP